MAASTTGGIALLVLAGGWVLDIPALRTLFGISNAMAPSTAIAFLLAAGGLWILRKEPASGARRTAGIVMGSLAAAPAASKLGEFLFGWPSVFDLTLSARDPGPFPGEMAVPTAIAFLLIAPAVALLDVETKRGWRPAQTLTLLSMTLPLLGLVGKLYGVHAVQQFVGGTVVMAIHTAVLFLLLAGGIMRSRPHSGVMRLFTDGGKAGALLRYLVPATAFVVIGVGWGRVIGENAGWYGTEFGSALFAVFTVTFLTGLTIGAARRLYRLDLERSESLERQRLVLASIGDAVAITDAEGRIVSINPALERLSGWTEGEVQGREHGQVFLLLDHEEQPVSHDERFLARAMRDREVVTSRGYGTLLVRRDGQVIPVSVTASPILGRDDAVVGGVDVIRDVAQQREVDQLKSSLISTVSHELRTPLTMIQGFSELLLARTDGNDEERYALGQIHSSAERLSRLIADLLSVSRIEAGRLEARPEDIDLEGLIREVVEPYSSHRDMRLAFKGPAVVRADRDKLFQVLTNLVSNAAKYSEPETPIEIRVMSGDGLAQIEVQDWGMGMNEEEVAHLFEKFFRADRSEVHVTPGTGLGLYITKKLLELQGGAIHPASEPGHGTTMTVTLPLADQGAPGREEAKDSAQVGR